ncbi:MAG: type II toxin-antitoxin system death-on-curing family toxin [Sediminibacterium sp.]|nr:type II toxin-antitoxin system death-on-curing family toxin [Sediminibacterium sp.]
MNHPFLDGNKRTGYVLMRLFLMAHNFDIHASQTEKYDFVVSIATGQLNFKDIVEWLNKHVVKKSV